MATFTFCSLSTQRDEQVRVSMKAIQKCERSLDNKNLKSYGRLDYWCGTKLWKIRLLVQSARLALRFLLLKTNKRGALFTCCTKMKLRGKEYSQCILVYLYITIFH